MLKLLSHLHCEFVWKGENTLVKLHLTANN